MSKNYLRLVVYIASAQDLSICLTRNSTNAQCVLWTLTFRRRKSLRLQYKAVRWECLYLRLDKMPCPRLLDLVEQRTWTLWNLPPADQSDVEVVIMTLLCPLILLLLQPNHGVVWKSINTGQKKMTVGIWRAGFGHFQRHICKLPAFLCDV